MNDRVVSELKVVVERAVRPVRAGDARKRRMREELFEHLTTIYEEESEPQGDESAALVQAKERFGDPRELTSGLQQSLSRLELVRYWMDLYRYRPGESLLRFGLRHLLPSFLAMAGAFLLVVPLVWLGGRLDEIDILAHIMLVMVLFSAGFSCSFTLIAELMGQTLYGQGSPHSKRAIVRYSLASLLVFPLMTALTHGGLMLSMSSALKGFLLGCTVAPIAPVFFYLLAREMREQISHESQWMGIEFDE